MSIAAKKHCRKSVDVDRGKDVNLGKIHEVKKNVEECDVNRGKLANQKLGQSNVHDNNRLQFLRLVSE